MSTTFKLSNNQDKNKKLQRKKKMTMKKNVCFLKSLISVYRFKV